MVNLLNGMLDLETGELEPHDKEYYSTVQIPIAFDPDAECPRFLQFLGELFRDNPTKARTLQDFSGYCLCNRIFIHKCLFLIGNGSNGKSTFINILNRIVGKENVSAIELHQLSNRFLLSHLKDKMLNVSTEVETSSQIESNIFKQIISGDLVQVDVKYKDPFSFRPTAKHIFSMNEIPIITDRTYAFARRLILVTFNQQFTGSDEDKHLEEKLTEELPGILNWCLLGLTNVLENERINESEQMLEDKNAFLRDINPVVGFVEDQCIFDEYCSVEKKELYKRYVEYCKESGVRSLGNARFYRQLVNDYPAIREVRPRSKGRHFDGIRLKIQ
jgi:putative DNA primase/helicase